MNENESWLPPNAQELRELLAGRTLRFAEIAGLSKNHDRALGVAFVDTETGDLIGLTAVMGAIEGSVLTTLNIEGVDLAATLPKRP